jgi:hypothetical protein
MSSPSDQQRPAADGSTPEGPRRATSKKGLPPPPIRDPGGWGVAPALTAVAPHRPRSHRRPTAAWVSGSPSSRCSRSTCSW